MQRDGIKKAREKLKWNSSKISNNPKEDRRGRNKGTKTEQRTSFKMTKACK